MPLLDSLLSTIPVWKHLQSRGETMKPARRHNHRFDLRFCVPNKEVMPRKVFIRWSTCSRVLCVTT
jgi:hypothetical protein